MSKNILIFMNFVYYYSMKSTKLTPIYKNNSYFRTKINIIKHFDNRTII